MGNNDVSWKTVEKLAYVIIAFCIIPTEIYFQRCLYVVLKAIRIDRIAFLQGPEVLYSIETRLDAAIVFGFNGDETGVHGVLLWYV